MLSSPILNVLKNRINLRQIPFTERGSRLLVFHENGSFIVRLAERWFNLNRQLSAYRGRPPLVEGLVFTDANGNVLPIEVTSYPHCLEIASPAGLFNLFFLDPETLLVLLPKAACGLRFSARLEQCTPDRRGGVLRMTGNIRRSLAYTTNARILKNTVAEIGPGLHTIQLNLDATQEGQAVLLNITPRLGFNRWVPDPDEALSAALQRWQAWFIAAPPVLPEYQEQYYYAWWIMRAGLLSTRYFTTREVMAPSKIYYIGSWQWDNFFHALAYRHVDARLAQDQLRILVDHQREDGMIPDAVHDEGVVTHLDFPVDADVTKPPLMAWAAWKLYEFDHDREFLDEIYGPIVRWNTWWFEKNDPDGNGLCEYQHPFSSGLDDSPLWDDGMPVESPDLNTYLVLQQQDLARIAREIGEADDAALWEQRAQAMVQKLIEIRWDDKAGLFWAVRQGQRVPVLTPLSLFPLLTGQMPGPISERLVEHLVNPNEFWSKFPVPSVALNDPKFNPRQMWRGPTWANLNYLLIEGLFKSGYPDLARQLRHLTLDLLTRNNDFYEYYDPNIGDNPPKAAPIYGWSAALFIDLAIQATREAQAVEA